MTFKCPFAARLTSIWAPHGAGMYAESVLRLIRFALLLVLFFLILGLVVGIAGPGTGPVEDAVLVAIVGALFALAIPVRRIGASAP